MAFLGKIFVFFNLMLSILFLSWALGVYMNRLDWAPHLNEMGKEIPNTGRLNELRAQMSPLLAAQQMAEKRRQSATRRLAPLEAKRPQTRDWYKEQLLILETGRNSKGEPAKVLALKEINNQLDMAEQSREPVKIGGNDALPFEEYNRIYQGLTADIITQQERVQKAVVAQEKLDKEIDALRVVIAKEKAALAQVLAEQEAIKPILYNTLAEGQLASKRRAALEARLLELEQAGKSVARQP
ncbi:MAG: hypothetical protein ACK4RK_18170 [Gemmataceae bacterium]